MMTRTFTFVLATVAAMAAVPQIAQASCRGDACNSVSFDGKQITNKDQQLKAQVSGCFIDAGTTCAKNAITFAFTIDPTKSQPIIATNRPVIRLDIQNATFVGTRPVPGPALLEKVTVTNSGPVPLKVVILDAGFRDIGRTPDYKTGSFDIALKKGVAKYHWEVFAPGAVEPCQKLRDETKSAISVQCQQQAKGPDAAHQPVTMPISEDSGNRWAEKCPVSGAGGPAETCCARQRHAEPYCMQQPQSASSSKDCDKAEQLCRQIARTYTGRREGGAAK